MLLQLFIIFLNLNDRAAVCYFVHLNNKKKKKKKKTMLNSFIEVSLIFYLVFCLFLSGTNSILSLIILGEILWLVFFLQLHLFLKAVSLLDITFFFFIILALITIDLGAALTLVIFDGSVKDYSDITFSKSVGSSRSLFKSVGEGSFLRNSGLF